MSKSVPAPAKNVCQTMDANLHFWDENAGGDTLDCAVTVVSFFAFVILCIRK